MYVSADIHERYLLHKKKISINSPQTEYDQCWMWDGGSTEWFHCLACLQEWKFVQVQQIMQCCEDTMVEVPVLLKSMASWETPHFSYPTQPDLNQCNHMLHHSRAERAHFCLKNSTYCCTEQTEYKSKMCKPLILLHKQIKKSISCQK